MNIGPDEFYKEITLRICGSLNIEQALSQTLEYLQQFLLVDGIGFIYSDLARKRLFIIASIGREGFNTFGHETGAEINMDDEYVQISEEIEFDRENISIINSPDNLPAGMLHAFPKLATRSALSLKLRIRDQMIGYFVVAAEGLNRYSEKDAKLLESVREPFAIAMSNVRRYDEQVRMKNMLAENYRALSDDIKQTSGFDVVGADFGLRDVMEKVRQVASSNSPTLLLGETGTGKEVIANTIHMLSPRQKGPMITLQCGAVPEALLGSELFGHEKGAFTGAFQRKRGRFERAEGGTLFLDEIGELSLEAQVKLLRVLQEKQFERVGGTKKFEADVRVIAATNRDLGKMVSEGTFREDLWYRINVLPIHIPPLRMRREDILSLVQYFITRKAREMNLPSIPQVDNYSLERLKAYNWPGNVRELQNIVERALILSKGDNLIFPELDNSTISQERTSTLLKPKKLPTMDQVVANHISTVLNHTGGRIEGDHGAAKILRMNPSTLRFRMKKLGIKSKEIPKLH